MGRTLGVIAGGAGRVLGFLGGPWGMAISLGMMAVPAILDFLKKDDKEDEEGREKVTLDDLNKLPIDQERIRGLNALGLKDMAKAEIKNHINVYVDGKKMAEKVTTSTTDEENDIILNAMYQQ